MTIAVADVTLHVSAAGRSTRPHGVTLALAVAGLVALAGCGKKEPPSPPAVPVKVMTVLQQDTPLFEEFVGEVSGSRQVSLRAQITGVLMGKHFDDGALVTEGQKLFTIDPRSPLAEQANARAGLAAARADLARARQDVARYGPLVKENAISKQIYDNAVAAMQAAQAQVAANQAAVDQASLGVEYATVTAPLTGRIGAAQVFPGDLITAGTTVLAELSEDDPVWVYFSISEAKLLDYERRYRGGTPHADDPIRQVRMTLSDGTEYKLPGMIIFADRALDTRTGTYRLRAEFPNPQHMLYPGLFARIQVRADQRKGALLVPDRAVVQTLGKYFVTTVGADGKALQVPVTPGPRYGGLWVMDKGLKPGDTVVVEGVQKARPGVPLKVTKVTYEQLQAPPAEAPPPGGPAKG
ncbi:efflux RND transporter periplasmic adaptor subunit [Lysobacter sp. GCM10012299]|uniref:efflux RND transporter periplasmic adaptor subunit n=1 Tax=Lysobacter sp. GCM10012299 TaxID=3317333 RepID=UPI00360A1CB2